MGDIITQWLKDKLGIIVNVNDESFLRMVVNGHLIALILRQYKIISADQLRSLETTAESEEIANRVIFWLKSLDPSLEEDAWNCFSVTKLSSTVKLFYRLYLALRGKDYLRASSSSITKLRLGSPSPSFHSIKPFASKDRLPVGEYPFKEHYHIIEWHKDRYKALLQKCKEAREAFMVELEMKEKKNQELTSHAVVKDSPKEDTDELDTQFDTQSLCETYDELKEQEKKALEMEIEAPNPKLADKIIKRLKEKYRQEQEERTMKAQMENILVTNVWNDTVQQQEQVIEKQLSTRILKQSNYEKHIANKLFEIAQQKYILAQNRDVIQKQVDKQLDEALLEYVFAKERQMSDNRYSYFFEREKTLNLHRRIYGERQRLMRERRENLCKGVVKDVVDVSLKQAEYKKEFFQEMSPKMKNDLVKLFVEGKSIFDVVEDIETVVDYVPIIDYEDEILLEDIDSPNAIDTQTFEDYRNLKGIYELDMHAPEFKPHLGDIQLAMNILSHIVFRLLLTKYPKPLLPTPPDIPKVEVAACIPNIPDVTILPILEKLLAERKIRIIKFEEAINYCLAAYKDEQNTEAPESQFVDDTKLPVADIKKKKEDKNKKKKVDPAAKVQKSKGKQKEKKKGEADTEPEEIPQFRDEMVQTPRVFPCEEYKLSNQAELGKEASEILNLGQSLGDEVLVKMFVEYLKTLKDIYGWVLVNYPQNFEQAVLLEEALTAKKLPQLLPSKILDPRDIPNLEKHFIDNITTTTLTVIHEEGHDVARTVTTLTHDPNTPNKVRVLTEHISWEGISTKRLSDIHIDLSPKDSIQKILEIFITKDISTKSRKSVSFSTDQLKPVTERQIIKDEISDQMVVDEPEIKVDDLTDLTFRHVGQNYINLDKNAVFRVSLLLSNPHVDPTEQHYNTYLTAFIRLTQDVCVANPHVVDTEELDVLPPLDTFYQSQGCHYTLYYKTLNFPAIKHLGKLIVGEYTIPPKSSVQIFGESVLHLEEDVTQPDTANETKNAKKGKKKEKKEKPKAKPEKKDKEKKTKEKDDKKEKKGRGKEKSEKKSKTDKDGVKKGKIDDDAEVMIERADKTTQVPTPEQESTVDFAEIPEPVPGTKDYVYVDLPITDYFEISLATIWENVEEVYVYDGRELFYRKRIVFQTVVPYMEFVRRYMKDYIARPDDKQTHVSNFQTIYNSIDADLRNDEEMKSQLHCRIYEFREKLWQICDQRLQEAEEERNKIISKDWLVRQACELTSIYITAIQIELDRCADTMALLNDYYMAMVTKMPCSSYGLEKVLLSKVHMAAYEDFDEAVIYKDFVRNMLKNNDFVLEDSPFHKNVRDNLQIAFDRVEAYDAFSKKEIAKIEGAVQPGKKSKPRKETKQVKNEKKWLKFSDPEPDVREQGHKLVLEWTTAINGEKLRTLLRLNMVKSLSNTTITYLLNFGIKTFHTIYGNIKARYERELKSVETCCAVFSRAVEEEMPIQPPLILRGDRFYIDSDILLFEDTVLEPEPPIDEYAQPETFTIDQLEMFAMNMLKFAPSGIIAEQAFLFLLQDMIVFAPEDSKKCAVPEIWRKLSYKSMNKLSFVFFGKSEKIDWRDFVLYNMCISFPTEEELMNTRRQFRELDEDNKEFVYDHQYYSVKFWYEKEFNMTNSQDLSRFQKIRKILFLMYALSEETVSYTQLLLGFCKGNTIAEGVAKALSLSLGKLVCHQKEIGEAFVETLREQKRKEMEEYLQYQLDEKEKLNTVRDVIDSLVDTTVHECDSCFLTDINDDQVTKKTDNSEPPEPLMENPYFSESAEYLNQLMKMYEPADMYEEEYYGDFYHEEFSNVEIGHEAYRNPPLVYYLSLEILLLVLIAAMPWHAVTKQVGEITFRQKLEKVCEELTNHEFDGIVLMHEFLNSTQFEELMRHTNKFVIINPRIVIRNLMAENT